MPNEWDADVEVTDGLARTLIESQFPELAPATVEPIGVGWDNAAFRINGHLVFRMPRRAMGGELITVETEWLPRIAPHLPLPVPVPQWVGKPAGHYPYPFAGYRELPGRTACTPDWTDAMREAAAEPLAAFLRTLHALPGCDDLPVDPNRANLRWRLKQVTDWLDDLRDEPLPVPHADILALAQSLAETPATASPPVPLHGDLYARHLLIDADGALAGVIDWGDMHRGDPAVDLSIGWSTLPSAAREHFFAAYGSPDPHTINRARMKALHYGVILLRYGRAKGDAGMAYAGQRALTLTVG